MTRSATLLLLLAGCGRTPEVVVSLVLDVATEARTSRVRTTLHNQDGERLRAFDDSLEEFLASPRFPVYAKNRDPERWFSIAFELFDSSGSDTPFAQSVAQVGFAADALLELELEITQACAGVSCPAGQTCVRGECRGACFDAERSSGNGTDPRCSRCELCEQHTCVARSDGDSCGCLGDRCRARACVSEDAATGLGVGLDTSCAIANGRLYCWGSNGRKQIGVPSAPTRVYMPLEVMEDVSVVATRGIKPQDGADSAHTCATYESAGVACWGQNDIHQLGLGDGASPSIDTPTPVPDLSAVSLAAVATGGTHTCARTTLDQLWCWGGNFRGQLGLGDTVSRPSPELIPPPTGGSWTSVCTGQVHTCGVSNGKVYCWGHNTSLQTGTSVGDIVSTAKEVAFGGTAATLSFTQVACGDFHSCTLAESGQAFCWGGNRYGNLGRSTAALNAPPGAVAGGESYQEIACGRSHCCAVTVAGEAQCWGRNEHGQLGVGSGVDSPEPAAVIGPRRAWAMLSLGDAHSCGALEDGTIWCWGYNERGQLGLGDDARRFSPERVCLQR